MSPSRGERATAPAYPAPPVLRRLRRDAILIGGIAGVGSIAAGIGDPAHFFRSYLVGFLFWLGPTLGCFALAMLHQLTGGAWGVVVRRVLEAASRTLPLMVLLFLPLLMGMDHLYVWSRPEWGMGDHALARKAAYLNDRAFVLRAALYFAVLGALVTLLNRWSLAQDRTGNPTLGRRMRFLSGLGLGIYILTVTFASIDWMMSIDPHWASSIYGVGFVGGQAVAGIAFVIVVGVFLSEHPPMKEVLSSRLFHDHGNLMLAFLMLWAYFAVSQLIIIWSGNLPEEIPFYLVRLGPGWKRVSLVLLLGHFALPFLLLVSRAVKSNPRALAGVAGLLFLMRWVDLYWQTAPGFYPNRPVLGLLDLTVWAAIGGVWVAVFAFELGTRSLVPIHDPHLEEALAHD